MSKSNDNIQVLEAADVLSAIYDDEDHPIIRGFQNLYALDTALIKFDDGSSLQIDRCLREDEYYLEIWDTAGGGGRATFEMYVDEPEPS